MLSQSIAVTTDISRKSHSNMNVLNKFCTLQPITVFSNWSQRYSVLISCVKRPCKTRSLFHPQPMNCLISLPTKKLSSAILPHIGFNRKLNDKIMAEHSDFQIRKADKTGTKKSDTLVLLFGFYAASERSIQSYCDIYHKHGYDVMYIRSQLKQFAWPINSRGLAIVLLEHLKKVSLDYKSIVVHGMSMGAYNFAIVTGELYEKPDLYKPIHDKIVAVIYDSMTIGTLKNMAVGVGLGASRNPVIQKVIPWTMRAYFAVTYPWTVRVFNLYIDQFKQKPLQIPTLIFYSKNDPMSEYQVLFDLIQEWRSRFSFHLTDKCWEKSRHAGHLQVHREEYLALINQFLASVPDLDVSSSKL